MGPKEKIERLAQTPEDRVLLARVWERLSAGQRREIPAFSCFSLSAGAGAGAPPHGGGDTDLFWWVSRGRAGGGLLFAAPIWRRTACMLKGR